MKFNKLLIKTAFACMACDGYLDERELECVKQFILAEVICEPEVLVSELNTLVDKFNSGSNAFMVEFFQELHDSELTDNEQIKIIQYALAITRADEIIDYREIKFFKLIRSHLSVSDNEIRSRFDNVDDFLNQDIISDSTKFKLERYFFDASEAENAKLMHVDGVPDGDDKHV